MEGISPFFMLLAGLLLLFSGRRIIWLAAAMAAFLFVFPIVQNLIGSELGGIIVAAVIALVISALAVRFIKFAGVLIGALAGAVALPYFLGLFGVDLAWWLLAVGGAILGMLAVSFALDWGLIVMTAWVGANAVLAAASDLLVLPGAISPVIFFVLLAVGILVQSGSIRSR